MTENLKQFDKLYQSTYTKTKIGKEGFGHNVLSDWN